MRKGQVFIVALLVLGIAMTVALAISSRSITDISTATTQDESTRALEAAEAGIEQALGGVFLLTGSGTLDTSNSSYNINAVTIGTNSAYEVPFTLADGEAASIDLSTSNITRDTRIRFCWGTGGVHPALEIMIYYLVNSTGEIRVARNGYQSAGSGGFVSGASSACGGLAISYSNGKVARLRDALSGGGFNLPSGITLQVMRLRMLNTTNPQPVAIQVVSGGSLVFQGRDITSTGTSGSTVQRVRVVEARPDLPSIFDNAIYSGGGIIK